MISFRTFYDEPNKVASPRIEALDLGEPLEGAFASTATASQPRSKDLAGFQGGQAYTDSEGNSFGLLVPFRGATAPLHGANSKLTADGFNGVGLVEGGEAVGGSHQVPRFASKVVRFHIPAADSGVSFRDAPFEYLDLSQVDPDLRGFSDGVVVGAHFYLVPYRNDATTRGGQAGFGYFGKVVQIDLEKFADAASGGGGRSRNPSLAVRVLDLTQTPPPGGAFATRTSASGFYGNAALSLGSRPDLVGFTAGLVWGKTLLLVPGRNGGGYHGDPNQRRRAATQGQPQHGKVVGIDLTVAPFGDPSAVSVLDLATVTRQQIPKVPDPELRGFSGGA